MGKRNHGKPGGRSKLPSEDKNLAKTPQKLSKQKRSELNQILEKLLKVTTNLHSSPNASKEWEIHIDTNKLLEKVKNLEKDMKVSVEEDRISNCQQMLLWMLENGAEIHGVQIAQFQGFGFGLQAEHDISENELIIAVPRVLMLTTDSAKQSAILGPLMKKDAMLQHMPNVALSLLLLIERFNPDSFWMPYIQALPQSYTTVLYFKTQELQELKGSPALESALKQCRNIARQYAYFSKLFQNNTDPASELLRDTFTYEQYCWAVSTVMTRQNFVPSVDGGAMLNALIPFWDMSNHDNGKLSTDFSPTQDRSECYAFQHFNSGDQVFIHYGSRSNADFLVHSGFVLPNNAHDTVRVRLGVSKADPLSSQRSRLLARIGLSPSGDFVLRAGPEPVDGRLLAFLRVFSMGKEQLEHWTTSPKVCDLVYIDCALDTDVESRTWSFLFARIQLLLSAYPTSLQVDEELLEQGHFSSACQRLAIELRVCEKQILHNALEYVGQRTHP